MPETIPKTQKAAVSHAAGQTIGIEEIPVVQPDHLGPGRALVKILYSGVCHTDLHLIEDEWPMKPARPCIPGHEGAGIIVALNDSQSTFNIGDRVGVKWIASTCNECSFCLTGYEQLCPKSICSCLSDIGTYQQYCPTYTSQLTPNPDGIELADAAPILCAGVTVYRALKSADLRPGQWIAIPGAGGGLGSLALQYAKYMGISTIACDTGTEKKDLCHNLGAGAWIDFKDTKDMVEAMKAATPDGFGPHAAMITATTPAAYELALSYVRPAGTVVAVGLPGNDPSVSASIFSTVSKVKTLRGSYVGSRLDAIESLHIAANTSVRSPYTFAPMEKLPEVFEKMRTGKITGRVVLDMFA